MLQYVLSSPAVPWAFSWEAELRSVTSPPSSPLWHFSLSVMWMYCFQLPCTMGVSFGGVGGMRVVTFVLEWIRSPAAAPHSQQRHLILCDALPYPKKLHWRTIWAWCDAYCLMFLNALTESKWLLLEGLACVRSLKRNRCPCILLTTYQTPKSGKESNLLRVTPPKNTHSRRAMPLCVFPEICIIVNRGGKSSQGSFSLSFWQII